MYIALQFASHLSVHAPMAASYHKGAGWEKPGGFSVLPKDTWDGD